MSIETIFNNQKVPENYKVPFKKNYDTYLLNGQIKKWSGKLSDVYSPIYSKNSEGVLQPILLGTVPQMGEKDAMEALDSANEAFSNGTGAWPTMRVSILEFSN